MKPDITVLMPVYNGQPFLREAIESILGQTYSNFELLIIDDTSKDDSAAIIQSFTDTRIRFIQNKENLGLIGTLNKGLDLAEGELIARMDQDDCALPQRLEKQWAQFNQWPELGALGTAFILIDTQGKKIGQLPVLTDPEQIKRVLTVKNPFVHTSMMFRRKVVKEIGGYDPAAYTAEDYDLWVRLAAHYPTSNLNEPLLKYRLNPQGMSISLRSRQAEKASEIASRAWNEFGISGPAPLNQWDKIWLLSPDHSLLQGELKEYARLHLLFAKAYRRRGGWSLALRHFLTSFKWNKSNPASYFSTLMFLMPYMTYAHLEEKVATFNLRKSDQ